jgi:hypothetical protein
MQMQVRSRTPPAKLADPAPNPQKRINLAAGTAAYYGINLATISRSRRKIHVAIQSVV